MPTNVNANSRETNGRPAGEPEGPQTIRSVAVLDGEEATRRRRGILARMRIRKKLIFLHTLFSLGLALVLVIALRPAVTNVVETAELDEAQLLLQALLPVNGGPGGSAGRAPGLAELAMRLDNVVIERGTPTELGLDSTVAAMASAQPLRPIAARSVTLGPVAVAFVPGDDTRPGEHLALAVQIPEARKAVWRLYMLTCAALLGVYALVAIALEVLVLPQGVYRPIAAMLEADRAVREGRVEEELVPGDQIPGDELGEIMRSRNGTVRALRQKEADLEDALKRLEVAANDLKVKNHLLETAQRNLADADRLASLGMMSAGIAHELNTPLAVVKGLAEKLNAGSGDGVRELSAAEAALLLRVVRRLEKLGESLLDFARVRPPSLAPAAVRGVVAEAQTLVALDRDARGVEIVNEVPESLVLRCDGDRLVQVFVNLLRNAVDAIGSGGSALARVVVSAEVVERENRRWASISVTDDGPGIDAEVLPRLFEPFATTKLDSRGTGLGLAVAEGIVREHGGLILARNRPAGRSGAVFEVMLPVEEIK